MQKYDRLIWSCIALYECIICIDHATHGGVCSQASDTWK
jgi:hypothetical protein